jgi:hypothetical protein
MMKNTRRLLLFAAILFSAYFRWQRSSTPESAADAPRDLAAETDRASSAAAEMAIEQAFANHLSDLQVGGAGTVSAILADDTQGSRHQKFLLRLPSGQTLLIAHNIDLAPRIDDLRKGDRVRFYGEYEYNDKGGVVHWTHHDPGRRHVDGWLLHNGNRYQ